MGRLNNAYDALCSQLTTAGLVVVKDSRNARPGTVVVEPTTIEVSSVRGGQLLLTAEVVCIVPPPGNSDAMRALNDLTDKVIDAVPAIAAQPGQYDIGGQSMPCMTVTVHYPASN